MEIKDRKVITELVVIRDTLKEIKKESMNFESEIKIAQCEASLTTLLNLIDTSLVIG